MSFSIIKIYKHGGLLISSDRNLFSPPSPSYSSHIDDIRAWREANERCKRLLLSSNVSTIDSMYLYMRNKEKMKRLNFNKLNNLVDSSKKQSFDFSNTTEESCRKARSRFRDICFCNDWDYFFTLTFRPDVVDRFSVADIIPLLNKFFKNYYRRNSGAYIAVPERHKDGSFHFHMLIASNNKDCSIVEAYSSLDGSPVCDSCGRQVYNLTSWTYGFSHGVKLDKDNSWAVRYISKYISKQERCFPRFYYSGGFLVRKPAILYIHDESVFDRLLEAGALKIDCADKDFNLCCLFLDDVLDPIDEIGV